MGKVTGRLLTHPAIAVLDLLVGALVGLRPSL